MKSTPLARVEIATDELRRAIQGKKIALMMNTSAIDNNGRLLIDVIVEEKWANVAFFFGMEHGVRGNLYAADGKLPKLDERTGIPIVNLYDYPGLIPPPEEIERVDAVVFCAQDVGVRHWTYTPWMMKLISSCAAAKREVIVLDRPNPIRGDIVEGAPIEAVYAGKHMLSGFEYPLRHGMTTGELAVMYNETKKIGAQLTVIRAKGWRRDAWYDETGLPWLPPSPNIPTPDSPLYFATTGLLQAADFSYGLGTTTPFAYVGAEDFCGHTLASELNMLGLDGVLFVPKYYQANVFDKSREGFSQRLTLCNGVMIVITDRNAYRPVTAQLHIMDTINRLYHDRVNFEQHSIARPRMGTDEICNALTAGESLVPIIEKWERQAKEFEVAREKYLLY